jgi:hypothetical protein
MTDEETIQAEADDTEADPDLSQLVERIVDLVMDRLRVAGPALARAVDMAAGTISAQPAVAAVGRDADPPIPATQLLQLRTATAHITLPMSVGDGALLVHSDRSLDEWAAGGGAKAVRTADPRAHDLTDAVALPFAPGGADPTNLVIDCDAAVLIGGATAPTGAGAVGADAAAAAAIAALPGSVGPYAEPQAIAIASALKLLLISSKVKVG